MVSVYETTGPQRVKCIIWLNREFVRVTFVIGIHYRQRFVLRPFFWFLANPSCLHLLHSIDHLIFLRLLFLYLTLASCKSSLLIPFVYLELSFYRHDSFLSVRHFILPSSALFISNSSEYEEYIPPNVGKEYNFRYSLFTYLKAIWHSIFFRSREVKLF